MLRRMGPLGGVLKLIPGMKEQIGDVDVDEKQLKRVEAIVLSMTPRERSVPHVIDGKRRLRIARGSGTQVEQVNQLLEARKQMENMMKQMGRGKMPGLPARRGSDGERTLCDAEVVVETQETEVRTEIKETNGCQAEAHARGLEEEPDLPGRRGRLAVAA